MRAIPTGNHVMRMPRREHGATLISLIGGVLVAVMVGVFAARAAEGQSLTIVSPKENAVIKGGELTVEWTLEMGGKPSHVHVKIDDGRPMVTHSNSKKLTNVAPGKHTITVWVVDSEHQPIGVEDTVTFVVE